MVQAEEDGWRRWVRRDISAVRPLGSYAAKRCPVRTQLDVLRPVEPAGVSEFLRGLGAAGLEHEAGVFDDLGEAFGLEEGDAPADRRQQEQETLRAMREGAPVIRGGRLPIDLDGRRVGEPDVLVRVGDGPVDGRWRYLPVDVKGHGILKPGRGHDVVVQSLEVLAAPRGDEAPTPDGRKDRTAREDTLQLAHYHRMLEACGHGTVGDAWGAIIGTEGLVAWYRLDLPLWSTPTSDEGRSKKVRSALDVYDFEFAFRLDIAAVAGQHQQDQSVDLLVAPMDCQECSECPWRHHCWPQLDLTRDVSRLPGVGYEQWRALHDAELGSIERLAALGDDEAVEGLKPNRIKELRLQARARASDQEVHARRLPAPTVPTADVEVDVDMENTPDGAYLWGATVTVRRPDLEADLAPGHRAFVTWASPLDEAARRQVFEEFWTWLRDVQATTEAAGASFLGFCWSAAAENRFLRDGAELSGCRPEVEEFIGSADWVDLYAWFKQGFVTGTGMGLKTVATALGFAWRDEDPGGAASITWYGEATDPELTAAAREAARARLLAYNEDDVRATLAVRDALRGRQVSLPPSAGTSPR